MSRSVELDPSRGCEALKGASCAFGVFDGVHRGHRSVIEDAIAGASESGGASAVITFDVDPDDIFSNGSHKKIMSDAQRLAALEALGPDILAVIPFDAGVASLPAGEFLRGAFGGNVPSEMHLGRDFRFGAKAQGSVEDMESVIGGMGAKVCAHELVSMGGAPITSTRIRELLAAGDIAGANALLGHPYEICEVVREGRHQGSDMGFSTANLHVPEERDILAPGVYAGYAFADGARYRAVMSVGVPPTFKDEAEANMEVHILDFAGDLYGKGICVQVTDHLREMRKFDTTEELIAAVSRDIAWARANLS